MQIKIHTIGLVIYLQLLSGPRRCPRRPIPPWRAVATTCALCLADLRNGAGLSLASNGPGFIPRTLCCVLRLAFPHLRHASFGHRSALRFHGTSSPGEAAVVSLLEVASLQPHISASNVRALVAKLKAPVSLVGEMHTRPALLVEVDSTLVKHFFRLLQPYSALEIVELRRHFRLDHLTRVRLTDLLVENRRARQLATGAAAIERAMQRRRLELLVVATELEDIYERMIESIVERHSYRGPLVASDLIREELGQAAGVRHAGCVGLLRGNRHSSL